MATSGRVCARHLAHVKYYINSYSFLTRSRKVTFDTHQVAYNHNCVRILSHMVPLAHVSVKDRLSIPVRVGRTAGNGTNAGSNAISRAVRDLTSGTCSSPDLSFEFCEEESKQGGRSKGNARIGGKFIVPGYAIAISLFSKEKNELDEAHEKLKKVDALEMLLRRAKLSESKKEWQEADKRYHEALALLSSRMQDKSWDENQVLQAQIYIFDNMANLALARGRLNESEILYKETMKGLFSIGRPKNDNSVVEISLKLAMIYAMQQRDKDAEAGYKFCMETQEKKLVNSEEIDEDTLGLLGMCINSFSRFLIIHGRISEAEGALRKTLSIAEKVLSQNHPQIAVLYSDLATTAMMQKDLDAAKSHIEKAVTIAEKTKSSDMATLWCNKGLIYLERGELSEAEAACRKALRLAKENNDKDMETEAAQCLEEIRSKRKKE